MSKTIGLVILGALLCWAIVMFVFVLNESWRKKK